MPATMLKNEVIYRQFSHSVAFANEKCCTCLRPLYLYFPDTPRIIAFTVKYTNKEGMKISRNCTMLSAGNFNIIPPQSIVISLSYNFTRYFLINILNECSVFPFPHSFFLT